MKSASQHRSFKALSLFTLIAVYFLILVGGIVRSTGSGMGCPDWPKCFGKLVPPTDVSQLPEDYKEYYAAYRDKKNKRFATYLDNLGLETKAEQIRQDDSILVEGDFNVYKTWTEYVNRLIGAIIGLLIFATMISSFQFLGKDNKLVVLSVAAFLFVGIQGWTGSVVVSTNLMPWTITIHMLLALFIVMLLISVAFRARKGDYKSTSISGKGFIQTWIVLCLIAISAQIVIGTQVREAIDTVAAELSHQGRDSWVSQTGLVFIIHRSFSLFLLLLHGILIFYLFRNHRKGNGLSKTGRLLFILIVIEIITGVIMAYFGMPPIFQPIHLLLSTLIFGFLYYMFLLSINHSGKLVFHSK